MKIEQMSDEQSGVTIEDAALRKKWEDEPYDIFDVVDIIKTWSKGIGLREFFFIYEDDNQMRVEAVQGCISSEPSIQFDDQKEPYFWLADPVLWELEQRFPDAESFQRLLFEHIFAMEYKYDNLSGSIGEYGRHVSKGNRTLLTYEESQNRFVEKMMEVLKEPV